MKAKSINALIGYSLAIGTLGFFTRMIEGIDLLTLVFFRTLLAGLFIFAFLFVTNRTHELIPNKIGLLLLNAVCQGGMMVTFIGAVLYTTISNTVVLNHSAPIFAIIFSRLFLKETIRHSTIFSIIISFVGMLLIVDFSDFSLQSTTAYGDMLGLASGLFFAGSMVSGKTLTKTNTSAGITFWQMALTTIALLPFIQMPSVPVLTQAALPLIGLGCIGTGLSYVLFMKGVENLDAQVVLIIPTIGLIFPAVGAWLIYGEALSSTAMFGSTLILAGVFLSQINLGGLSPAKEHQLQPSSASKTI